MRAPTVSIILGWVISAVVGGGCLYGPDELYCESHKDCADPTPFCLVSEEGEPFSDQGERLDRTCVAAVYVAKDGEDHENCGDFEDACGTVQAGIDRAAQLQREAVRIAAGTYDEAVAISQRKVTVFADNGAEIIARPLGRSAITINGDIAVTMEGITLRDAETVSDRGGHGIDCRLGFLEVRGSTILDNDGLGIRVGPGCAAIVEQSRILDNEGGGVYVIQGYVDLTNNIIAENGEQDSTVGGVRLTLGSIGSIQFNTVTNNRINNATDLGPGVQCPIGGPSGNIPAFNNLVQNNTGKPAVGQVSGGGCMWRFSALDANDDIGSGEGLTAESCALDQDWRLVASDRACVDKAVELFISDMEPLVTVDVDGDPRPSGDAPDIGADELQLR